MIRTIISILSAAFVLMVASLPAQAFSICDMVPAGVSCVYEDVTGRNIARDGEGASQPNRDSQPDRDTDTETDSDDDRGGKPGKGKGRGKGKGKGNRS